MFDNKNFALVKANRLFAGTDQKIKISISSKDLLTFSEGSTIYNKDDSAEGIYLIIRGEVKLEVPGIFKKPINVTKTKDDFFGELEYLENSGRQGSAVAASDSFLCFLNKEKIEKITGKDIKILNNLLRTEGSAADTEISFDAADSIDEDEDFFGSFVPGDEEKSEVEDKTSTPAPETKDSEITEELEKILSDDEIPEIDFEIPDSNDDTLEADFNFDLELPELDDIISMHDETVDSNLSDADEFVFDSESEDESISEELLNDLRIIDKKFAEEDDLSEELSEEEISYDEDLQADLDLLKSLNMYDDETLDEISGIDFNIPEIDETESEDVPASRLFEGDDYEEEAELTELSIPEITPAEKKEPDEKEIIPAETKVPDVPPEEKIIPDKLEAAENIEPVKSEDKKEVKPVEAEKKKIIEPAVPEKKKEIEKAEAEKKKDVKPVESENKEKIIPAETDLSRVTEEKREDTFTPKEVIPVDEFTEEAKPEKIPVTSEKQDKEKPAVDKIDVKTETAGKESVKPEKEISKKEKEIIPVEKGKSDQDLLETLMNDPEAAETELIEIPEEKSPETLQKPEIPEEEETPGVLIHSDNEEEVDEMTAAQFKRLMEASQKISASIKLDETLDAIVDAAKSLTDAEHGILYIVDRDSNELWSKSVNGEVDIENRIKLGEDAAGLAAQKNQIVNIPNAQKDTRFNKQQDKLNKTKTKSLLCFPVTNKSGYVTAVLQLSNSGKGEFNLSDEEALSALSLNISLALENAELIEKQLQNDRLSSLGKMANFLIQDIKKPVLTIKYYAEHIKKKEVSADVVQIVNMLIDQSNSVVDLVQTTLSYSEGKGILKAQPLRLSTVLNDIFNLLAEYVESRNVNLFKKYEADAVVNIDKREFYQACFQIVKNACDAMPGGGDIYILIVIEGDRIKIEFKDSGFGIPESIKGRIFEPFMTHGKKQGVGLGLSIAEKIVKDHGGTITFESEVGEGTTFKIALPFLSTV